LNPKFKAIMRAPEFHEQVGLFAIDELHVVGDWREFRPDFSYLHSLRSLFPRTIPWFGCTATLDRDNQEYILKHAGFDKDRLAIIRTSVDRPNISVVVQPLLRRSITDFRRLGKSPSITTIATPSRQKRRQVVRRVFLLLLLSRSTSIGTDLVFALAPRADCQLDDVFGDIVVVALQLGINLLALVAVENREL
jgi:superfamily II DNA helicase RecQ